MAQSMMNAVMAAGDAGTMLPIDAIDEFKTVQNARAEYGWKPGSIVNVGIKSGTNTIHGSAYAYGRTTGFDARNYYNLAPNGNTCAGSSDLTPCVKTPVELEQWGISFGGPIKKDKLFYFGNFETQNYNVGNPASHNLPITTASATSPDSLVGACLAALASPAGLAPLSAQLAGLNTDCTTKSNYPGLFPVNNTGSTANVSTALVSQSKIYSGVGKIDYQINEKNSLSGMYFRSPGDGIFVDDPTNEISPTWRTVQNAVSQVMSVGETYLPNSNWVNSFRFGYSHYYQVFTTQDANQDPSNYSYNGSTYNFYTGQTNPTYFGFPRTRFKEFPGFQLGLSWPKTVGPDSVWQFSDSVSYLHGNHAFKFGGEVLIDQSTNNVTNNTKGNFRFNTLTNFFQGQLNQATIATGDYLRHLQNQGYAAFVQDDWRITPRFTLNLGLRYELLTVVKDKNDLLGNFDPAVGLEQVGKQIPSLYHGDHNNFSPRLGFAWDVMGDGKTVVRGGASVMYEQISYDVMMAYSNLWGLKTIPTGATLYVNGSSIGTAGGTINTSAVGPVSGGQLFGSSSGGTSTSPALGSLNYNYFNNSSSTPLYSFSKAACGDGNPVPGVLPTPQPCSILAMDQNLRTPYVTALSLGIQRALTNDLSLEVNYVGNHGTKFLGMIDMNQPTLVNGFSPGWGNPADPTSAAGVCLASASTGYDNCAPNTP
ncbi:MAG: TonB-dependent receptor domain-containing protein, partial [Candidatus Acidiferrales bacterium]